MGDGPRRSQCPQLKDHDCENYQLPVNPETMHDLLLQVDRYKSLGPGEIRLSNFERFCLSREVPDDWKLANIVPVRKNCRKKDPRNCRPVSLTSAW
ncbi:hypothetical protein WISP_99083 [Willisornis vidua]|uniref:Uncharacterized protein n=1 Tax=Willisornis vidua TaxID=1566151 RepID=A0ABQ9D4F7_9PASS|nr:hypothetical protein WISP_99083 [Willisornis vidua]